MDQTTVTEPAPLHLVTGQPADAPAWAIALAGGGVVLLVLGLCLFIAAWRAWVHERCGGEIAFRTLCRRLAVSREERRAMRAAASAAGIAPVAACLSDRALRLAWSGLAGRAGTGEILTPFAALCARRGVEIPAALEHGQGGKVASSATASKAATSGSPVPRRSRGGQSTT